MRPLRSDVRPCMVSFFRNALAFFVAIAWFPTVLMAQSDNFNQGNDNGWERYDPFSQFGQQYTGSFTFPNGQYRIQAAPSPDPVNYGPGRAASLRADVEYTNFTASIDITQWDTSTNQALGLLARINNLGLGTTNGYVLTYSTGTHDLDLSRVTGEVGHGFANTVSVPSNSAQTLRLVFSGIGPAFTGSIYDAANPATPLATIMGTDATYGMGFNGLLVYDNDTQNTGGAATFDNFNAFDPTAPIPEPAQLALSALAGALAMVRRRATAAAL